MISLICLVILLLTFFISNHYFKNWFNHLNLYVLGWSVFILLYEMKLIRFIEIQPETWFIILSSYFGITLGSLTVFNARSIFIKQNQSEDIAVSYINSHTIKYIKYLILFFSILGLIAALQNWFALIGKYGSVFKVLLKANAIYRDRISGDEVGGIPYLFIASNIGLFFAGIYTAYYKRFTIVSFLPFLGIILKGIASVGRGGIFVGFLQFAITTILFFYYLKKQNNIDMKLNYKSFTSLIIVLFISIGSMALVKELRGSFDTYKGTSKELKQFEGSIISPQIYLYFSSNIAVLSKYFEKDDESVRFGENTFLPFYNVISKFGFIDPGKVYPKGYFVPMWTNSATYLRDIHADFGYIGLFLVPYLLGMLATFYWIKFFDKGKLLDFVLLTYIYIIISFSVFYMISRAASWFVSFVFLLFIAPIFEKYLKNKKKTIHE